jgi:hypothetical protein
MNSSTRISGGKRTAVTTIRFSPKDKETGEPTKLVFKGSRPVEVDVPFKLNDIVLEKK